MPMDDFSPPRLYAIDAATGNQVWAADFGATNSVFSTPAVADGFVLVGVTHPDDNTGAWRAFEAKTGAEKWSVETTGGVWWIGAAIAEGVAFLNDPDANALVAVDLQAGTEGWRHDTGAGTYISVSVSRDAVYVSVASGALLALDRTTGNELWRFDLFTEGNSVTISDGKLFMERGGLVYALTDADDPRALSLSEPPAVPTDGPGSEPSAFPAARSTHYGDDPGGFWIVEPAMGEDNGSPVAGSPPLPVLLYLSGCCGNGDYPTPEEVEGWAEHLARSGYIIIAPVYNSQNAMTDAVRLLKLAMDELKQPGHAVPNYDRFGVIGYSFGGAMAVNYVGEAADQGLPVPQAIFLDAPCEGSVIGFCVPLSGPLTLPDDLKAVVLVYSDDFAVSSGSATALWAALGGIPAENRDFVTMTTDLRIDAADWYGIWKLSTALFDCAFAGASCEYALGNTPEQTFMGTWSDGTPVTPLTVTDEPGPPPGQEEEPAASPEADATPAN